MPHKLVTKALRQELLRNGLDRPHAEDVKPVVKLFTPDAGATWLLTEIGPEDQDIAWGLCDLGLGFPELGPVRLSEIASMRGKLGLPVERDLYFRPDRTLAEYYREALERGAIRA